MKRTITEFVNIPDHEERTTSAEFIRNRKILINNRKIGCIICNSQKKQEAHHLHEWALWNALDPRKVLETLKVLDFHGYVAKDPNTPITSPDDIRNLAILCGEYTDADGVVVAGGHHRGVNLGVHALTFPTWVAQKSVKDGLSITKAISVITDIDKSKIGTKQKVKQ